MQQGSSLKLKSLGQKIPDSSLFRDVLISGYHFYTNAPKSNTKLNYHRFREFRIRNKRSMGE